MSVRVVWPNAAGSFLVQRLRQIHADAQGNSHKTARLKGDVRTIVQQDHIDKMFRNRTRYGGERAPLATSTLKHRARTGGYGPSLIPKGWLSRYITTWRAIWVTDETDARILKIFFLDFVSPRGFPIPVAHEFGAAKPGTRWVLPARPVMGLTRRGVEQIRERHKKYLDNLVRKGG